MSILQTWLAPERLARLRQKQESSFTPIFLHRPLAILALIATADVQWITPNRITLVSTLMRFVTAALLWPEQMGGFKETPATLWGAIVLWHVGSVMDAMDGALARYRGQSSGFGRYIDKVPDRLISLSLVLALAARAYVSTEEVGYVMLGMIYVCITGVTSTAKWIELGIRAELEPGGNAKDPIEVAAPKRSALGWVRYWLWSLRTIFVVTEMDLPLWGSVAVVLGKEHWLLVYLAAYIVPYASVTLVVRGKRLWDLDARNAAARASSSAPR